MEGRGNGGSDPCFEATAAAEYGRDKPEKRGWEKKVSTAAMREAKASDSSEGVGASRGSAVGRAYVADEDNDLDNCLKKGFDDGQCRKYMMVTEGSKVQPTIGSHGNRVKIISIQLRDTQMSATKYAT